MTLSFGDSSATKMSVPTGGSFTLKASFGTEGEATACTQFSLTAAATGTGSPISYIIAENVDEDVEYTKTVTAPSSAGVWTLQGVVDWSTETPPVDLLTFNGNVLYLVVWDESTSPSGGFSENAAPTGGFTENTAPSGSWTETTKPSGSWTETEPPDGSWTEGQP